MIGKVEYRLKSLVHRYIFFKSSKSSFKELIYYYALGITFLLAFVSIFTNPILEIPLYLNVYTIVALPLILFLYWLSRFKGRTQLSQNIYLVFVSISFNIIWFATEGSAGGALIIVQAFLFMLIFFSTSNQLKWVLPLIFVNILILFSIEILLPGLVINYETHLNRSMDVFIITLVFYMFEIPVILFAKSSIDRDRIDAIQSEAQKTSLFVNLSHEIRTPMNAILGFSELLEEDDLDEEKRKHYVKIVNQSGRLLLNLLNNILNLNRLDSKKIEVCSTRFNPDEILDQIINMLAQGCCDKKNIELQIIKPEQTIEVETDSTILYQIIINLGYNAVKFTENGFVHIGYFTVEDDVIFYVKDTGIGISKEESEKIFKPYLQSKSTNVFNNPNGAGLGLAISKGLAQLLKAELWFESTKDVGTTFYLKLPLHR